MRLWSDSSSHRSKTPKCLRMREGVIRALKHQESVSKKADKVYRLSEKAESGVRRVNKKYESSCVRVKRCPHGRNTKTGKCRAKKRKG